MEIIVNNINEELINPRVIKRVRGGFLALSPRNAPIRVGAVAATEEDAREAFGAIVLNWRRSRDAERAPHSEPMGNGCANG
jgi:hypothetical protein